MEKLSYRVRFLVILTIIILQPSQLKVLEETKKTNTQSKNPQE